MAWRGRAVAACVSVRLAVFFCFFDVGFCVFFLFSFHRRGAVGGKPVNEPQPKLRSWDAGSEIIEFCSLVVVDNVATIQRR